MHDIKKDLSLNALAGASDKPFQIAGSEKIPQSYYTTYSKNAYQESYKGDLRALDEYWKYRCIEPVNGARADFRRPVWRLPSYLDICTSAQQHEQIEEKADRLEYLKKCSRTWRGFESNEQNVESTEFRPVGCGDRVACPNCADYYNTTVSREAADMFDEMLNAMFDKSVASRNDVLAHHLTFTVPYKVSLRIDYLIKNEPERARDLINKLNQLVNRCIRKLVKQMCRELGIPEDMEPGFYSVVHFWQSSAPWKPHFHIHVLLMNHLCQYDEAEIVGSDYVSRKETVYTFESQYKLWDWWDSEKHYKFLRTIWKKGVERIVSQKFDVEFDINHKFLKSGKDKEGQPVSGQERIMRLIYYQGRAPMRDFWRGIRKDENGFYYRSKKVPAPLYVSEGNFLEALERADLMQKHITRRRWGGYLSNRHKAGVLKALGLAQCKVEDPEVRPKHSPADRYWKPVHSDRGGVIFECITEGEEGILAHKRWCELSFNPMSAINGKPIGKRRPKKWYYPGAIKVCG